MAFFDNLTKKVGEAAKTAAKKSGDLVETTKINMAINSEQEKIKAIYTEMGSRLFDKYKGGEEIYPEFLDSCQQIKGIEDNIEALKEKINQIKNEASQYNEAPQYSAPPQYNAPPQADQPYQQPYQQNGWQQPIQPQGQEAPQFVPSSMPQAASQTAQEAPEQQPQTIPQYIPVSESLPQTSEEQPQTAPQNVCPSCGASLLPGTKFCSSCGTKL